MQSTITRQPAAEGPDVVYVDGAFVAYSNGRKVDSFENSQLAWSAARSATFAPTPSEYTSQLVSLLERIEQHLDICDKCHQPIDKMGRCGCDYSLLPAVTVTRTLEQDPDDASEPAWTMASFQAGKAELSFSEELDGTIGERCSFTYNTTIFDLDRSGVRDLIALLTQLYVQQWAGVAPVAPLSSSPVTIADDICEDHTNKKRYGTPTGTNFLAGNGDEQVEMHFPDLGIYRNYDVNAPDVFSPALGESYDPDTFFRVLENANALMNDPRVQRARIRWAAGLHPVPAKEAM